MTSESVFSPRVDLSWRPISDGYQRNESLFQAEFASFMLNASGWRKVFAENEESHAETLSAENAELAAGAASAFAKFVREKSVDSLPVVALGFDTRPTGPAIAEILLRVLLAEGVTVRFVGIAAAPEIMAYAKCAKLTAFVYVTASHNPIGHNGFKFGLSDGGVLNSSDSQSLAASFRELASNARRCAAVLSAAAAIEPVRLRSLYSEEPQWKEAALAAYSKFTNEVITGFADEEKQRSALAILRERANARGIGVIAELNGSARTRSIDETYLSGLGVRVRVLNGTPGSIVHRIVPEGLSLDPCREALERAYRDDHGALIGYVPDNDGDRGNIVFINEKTGRGEILHAQEVFALCTVAELAYLVYTGRLTYNDSGKAVQKVAIVVNDPTSLRIDFIAKAFDARVFRAEVGEANVVSLARDSRKSGFIVRILGEGSNGGNITYPSAVRDPIDTVAAFLKLLLLQTDGGTAGLAEIWSKRSGQRIAPASGLAEILESLPTFQTTDVYEPRAIVEIRSRDHAGLKERYEEIFSAEWEVKRDELRSRLGVSSWEEINYEGINEVHGFGRSYRSGKQRGGLKLLFKDEHGRGCAFIWMRGSNTEPVFRVMADVRGDDPADEMWLLDWHVSMLRRADAPAAT